MDEHLYRRTPIMGWASWNCFRNRISEEIIKAQADALVSTGLAECGYNYFNLDDGFFGGRDENGRLRFHPDRFPNGIRPISDHAHALGLKAGIYTEGGDNTCCYYYDNDTDTGCGVGLYQHEESDLYQLLVENNFDFIKIDWCGGLRLGLDEKEQYTKIASIIDRIRHEENRSIVFNLCRWQFPGEWAVDIADSWRTGADIEPVFSSVLQQIDNIKDLAKYCQPGHVNDLDMMQIGNGLTPEEEKSHFIMWCMMSTPLMIGCDLTTIPEETLAILKNKELIAINQDAACLQATVAKSFYENDKLVGEIWVKDLDQKNSTHKAVALLNRSEVPITITCDFKDLYLDGLITELRDAWNHQDLEPQDTITCTVFPHQTLVYTVKATSAVSYPEVEDTPFVPKPFDPITKEEMEKLLSEGAVLVDVRTPEEYAQGHLEGAINMPHDSSHYTAYRLLRNKQTPIIVYCSTGKRSFQAKRSLDYLLYENVYYLGAVEI